MGDLVIETSELTHRYGDVVAVDRVSLRVSRGSIYGFLGPNGAGKTTTIRALLGLVRPTSGSVALFGHSLRERRASVLARIGALVETPSLYPHLTGRENLEVTRRLVGAPRSQIDRAPGVVRLADAAHRLVRGYSLGMRQRLGLALALVRDPQLLILDEPTNGLDPAGIREMRDLIRDLPAAHGITVFVSSHLLGEVEQTASHVGIIDHGRLLFEGSLDELRSRSRRSVAIEVDRAVQAYHALREAGWDVALASASEGRLTMPLAGRDDVARVNALLVGGGFHVYGLRTERPTLEEIFFDLTGPSLDDEPTPERGIA